jgi:hypothetical protein
MKGTFFMALALLAGAISAQDGETNDYNYEAEVAAEVEVEMEAKVKVEVEAVTIDPTGTRMFSNNVTLPA